MALKNINEPDPLAILTLEGKKHTDKMKSELDAADKALDSIEELEIDVSKLRAKIAWGRKAVDIILKHLT